MKAASKLVLLLILPLLLLATVELRGGEPEDFKAISQLIELGVTRSALMRSKVYLERYPQGEHRPQVAAWAGSLLLRNGDSASAVPLLEEALLGLPPKEAEMVLLDWAQALSDIGQNREAIAALEGLQPQDEMARERAQMIREKAREREKEAGAQAAAPAPGDSVPLAQPGHETPAGDALKEPPPPAQPPVGASAATPPPKPAPGPGLPPLAVEEFRPMDQATKAPASPPAGDSGPAPPLTGTGKPSPPQTETPSGPSPQAEPEPPRARPAPAVRGPEREALDSALALLSAGKDAQAAEQLSPLLARGALDPGSAREARLALATAKYRMKEYKGALAVLAPLTEVPSPDPEACMLKAWCLHAQGKEEAAFDAARKGAPLKGWEDAAALFPLRLAQAERDPDKVLAAANAILQKNEQSPAGVQARVVMAGVLESRGDKAGALAALEAAIPQMERGEEQFQASLQAARLAWTEVRDPRRAQRWLELAEQTAESPDDKAQAALARARIEWERGESTNAVEALSGLVKNYPKTEPIADAYLLLGQIFVIEGNRERGRESLEVVTSSFPNSDAAPEAWLLIAESLTAEGRGAEAAPVVKALGEAPLNENQLARLVKLQNLLAQSLGRDAVMSKPKPPAPDSKAGREAAQRAAYESALNDVAKGRAQAALETAATRIKDPELADAVRFRAADFLAASGKREEARRIWAMLADEKDPRSPLALWLLAGSLLSSELLEQGMATLKQLAAYPPSEPLSVLAQHRLEMAFLAQNGPKAALQAIPEFRLAQPPAPGEEEAALATARRTAQEGRRQEAAKLYQTYLLRFPRGSGVHEAELFLGKEAIARSDWAEAAKDLKASPQTPERDYLLGLACYRMGDMAGCVDALERALLTPLELKPDQAVQALYMAGESARKLQKAAQAVDHYSDYVRVAKVTADNKEKLLDAALYLQHAEQYEAAIAAFDRIRKVFKDPPISFQYAYTLELAGRKEEALAAFLQVGRGPSPMWAPTARYRAAEIYVQLGKTKEAVELYKNLANAMKGTTQGNFAKERLAELQAQLAAEQAATAKLKPAPKKPEPAKKKTIGPPSPPKPSETPAKKG